LKGRLTLHFRPGDAPDLNPDEIGVELHQAHGRSAQPAAQWREAGRSGA
ncbi:transposase, partial [Xanthomonas oryzae pv. oryzae]